MKNYIIYFGLIASGMFLGWLIFTDAAEKKNEHDHEATVETIDMWTCSMHPQIMQPEPGDCPICGMELIPAENGSEGLLVGQFKLTENAMALANIQTTVVGSGMESDSRIKLSGKIVENEEANTVQASYFSGRIDQLNVSFTGEEIGKGQLLATIYSPELYAAQQELITAASLKTSQPALYNAVRNKLKLWKLSESQITQIEASGKVQENFPVYATVSGTVTEKLVEQGDYVKQGQPLLKIANLNTVWANFDVYENQIDLFKIGQDIKITTNAYPNKIFTAKVGFINPVMDTKSRTVKLRAVLNNSGNVFKPGMFVEGTIESKYSAGEQQLSIPASAVLWTGERSVVYLKAKTETPVFEMREVVLGNKAGENYEVLEGLMDGDEIVTNGTFTVDAAAQLQGKKSMMNREGGRTSTGHEGHTEMAPNNSGSNATIPETHKRVEVSGEFQDQLRIVFEAYIDLKDDLVQDKSKKVEEAAKVLLNAVKKADMKLLNDPELHNHWMNLETEIKGSANAISKTTDISEQRHLFKNLSSHLATAVQVFGINEKVYHQFCPMADNNTGGYWLSKEEKVLNPYFGSAMLSCGEVIEIIE